MKARLRIEHLEPRQLLSITFTQLTNVPPNGDSITALYLLSDGRVLASGGGDSPSSNWYTLTPDSQGNYADGTWAKVASSNDDRLFYGSAMLPNGTFIVSGGEYGAGHYDNAEIYDPVKNTWTFTSSANLGFDGFSDCSSTILPNGDYMCQGPFGPVDVYDPTTNIWTTAASPLAGGNEEAWVQQPDGTILKIDGWDSPNTTSERYFPSTDQWVAMGTTPANVWDANGEEGPAFLLPSQNTIFFGASGHTDIYTPGPLGSTTPGTWAAGPDLPQGVLPDDAPGAMFPDGNVLIAGDNGGFNGPTTIAEYSPTNNSFTIVNNAPSNGNPSFANQFLVLPNGQILYDTDSPTAYVISETGSPDPSWRPTVSSVLQNPDGSYLLTGTQLNGISEGAGYGDDYRPSTNYPIVQLVASDGTVYDCRTFNWTNTGVATGNTLVSTDFTVPNGIPQGNYTLYYDCQRDFVAALQLRGESQSRRQSVRGHQQRRHRRRRRPGSGRRHRLHRSEKRRSFRARGPDQRDRFEWQLRFRRSFPGHLYDLYCSSRRSKPDHRFTERLHWPGTEWHRPSHRRFPRRQHQRHRLQRSFRHRRFQCGRSAVPRSQGPAHQCDNGHDHT
jgi:hypothetical protein